MDGAGGLGIVGVGGFIKGLDVGAKGTLAVFLVIKVESVHNHVEAEVR